jgi:serine/threonine-protein kinase
VFKVVYGEPESLDKAVPSLPPAVLKAVKRALEKEPAKRYPDVISFVAELTGKPVSTLDRARSESEGFDAFAPTTDARSIEHGPTPGKKSRAWLWAVLGVLVVGGGAAAAVVALKGTGTGPVAVRPSVADAASASVSASVSDAASASVSVSVADAASVSVSASVSDAASVSVSVADAATVALRPPATAPATQAIAVAPTTHATPATRPVARPSPPPEPKPPAAVLAELAEAEHALSATKYDDAIRTARHTLTTRKTSEAYSVIARAYCGLRDLGNANAVLQNVRGAERQKVFRRCRALGFPLAE